MSLSDTAEYWHDVKKPFYKFTFTHIKGIDCGHSHRCESDELNDINCHACKNILENDQELKLKLESNNGKRYRKHRNKKGFNLNSYVKFGKYKGKTIQWIIENDLNYFNWLSQKILTHTEVDEFLKRKK